jgi:hypothetical protein
VQLHFTTRVRYGFLSVQLNYTIRHLICLKPFLILSLPYALPFQGKVKGLPWPFALLNSRKKEGPSVGKILLFYLIR